MSENAMFNIPPTKRSSHMPSLQLSIPSPSLTSSNANDGSIYDLTSAARNPGPPRMMTNPLRPINIASSASSGCSASNLPSLNPSASSLPNIPHSARKPRRKPPAVDFSKIDGSHSFTPSIVSGSSSQSSMANCNSHSEPGLYMSSADTSPSSRDSNIMDTGSDRSSRVASQIGPVDDLNELAPEDWNFLANSENIVEISKLGEGNSGSVSKCVLKNGSPVFALKMINTDPNPNVQKQILRELQYNRSCNSPNIVKYYGTFMVSKQSMIGIAMEYMGGSTLDAIYKRVIELDSTNRVNEKVLGKISESVLKGLRYLHEQKIIHRDIKPSNILLDKYGNSKICDFGVSGEVVNSLATTFVGTQYYMAPERIMGKPYTVNCDVWSLGLSLLEVAKGEFPYHSQSSQGPLGPIDLLQLILDYEPKLEDAPEEGIFWSDSFKNFLGYCLKKNPDDRPSPEEILQHPWVVGQASIPVNMERFVKRLWGDNLN